MNPVAATIASERASLVPSAKTAPVGVRRSSAGLIVHASTPERVDESHVNERNALRGIWARNSAFGIPYRVRSPERGVEPWPIRVRFAMRRRQQRSDRMLVRCTGRPNGSRGTIGGGVRTLTAACAAPLSTQVGRNLRAAVALLRPREHAGCRRKGAAFRCAPPSARAGPL